MKDTSGLIERLRGAGIASLAAIAAIVLALALSFGGAALAQDGDEPTEQQPAVESADDHDQSASDALSNIAPFETWQMVSGMILSGFIIPIVQKRRYQPEARKAIALAFAIVVGLIGSYLRGELDNFTYTGTAIMQVTGVIFLSYETVWKSKFLAAVPQKIESTVNA